MFRVDSHDREFRSVEPPRGRLRMIDGEELPDALLPDPSRRFVLL